MIRRLRALPRASRIRLLVGGAVGGAALAFVAAYGYLVVSTANAPPGARLSQSPSPRAGSTAPTAARSPTKYEGAEGPWAVAPENAGFVGYRAREILAIDFFRAPNDAVGRTTNVQGTLQITGTRLTAADIVAQVQELRSDEEARDSHVVEYLNLREHPTAEFRLTQPVEIERPVQGQVVDVKASGRLTIIDVTREVVFPLQARWDGDAIQVAGQIALRRSDYHMDVGQLLGFRVADDITIELELRFVRPCDPCVAGSPGATAAPESPAPGSTAPVSPNPSPTATINPDQPDRTANTLPGGGALAFTGLIDRGGQAPPDGQIYLLVAGSSPRALTDATDFLSEPAWSRDGRLITYVDQSEDHPPRVWVMNANGSGARMLNMERDLVSPDWSPDGRRIVCVPAGPQLGQLIVVNVGSGALKMILQDKGGVDETPDWSPDGRRIVFARFQTASSNQDLWLINPDGTGLRRLTTDPGYEYSPDWSADGRRIAFIREGDVWVINADGRGARRLTHGLKADSPAWSPDGRRIAFTVEKELWVMNADGSEKTRIQLDFSVVAYPSWRPR